MFTLCGKGLGCTSVWQCGREVMLGEKSQQRAVSESCPSHMSPGPTGTCHCCVRLFTLVMALH